MLHATHYLNSHVEENTSLVLAHFSLGQITSRNVIITVFISPLQSIVKRKTLLAGEDVCGLVLCYAIARFEQEALSASEQPCVLLHCATQKRWYRSWPSHFFITFAITHAFPCVLLHCAAQKRWYRLWPSHSSITFGITHAFSWWSSCSQTFLAGQEVCGLVRCATSPLQSIVKWEIFPAGQEVYGLL